MKSIILAITGASGAIYAKRLFDFILTETNIDIRLIISKNGYIVFKNELQLTQSYFENNRVFIYDNMNMNSNIASGSAGVDSMVVVPGSMGAIARIANGISLDLISRTADVMLKERKKLLLVPRETPYNDVHLKNMLTLSRMGAVIISASPGFYHIPKTIDDLIDFVVAKVLNQLGIENNLLPDWEPTTAGEG